MTAWSLLLIAWLTLHWWILPHIQQWRGPLETRASQALGVPVRIGHIEVKSSGWVPSFELRDVLLLDADQRPALRLPRVFAAISPRSLLSLQLRFEQLLVDGAELELRRDATGRIFIAGLDLSGPDTGDGSAAADWFFKQREFVIRGGSVRWTDEQRNAPALALTDVQLVVRNTRNQHTMRLDATPPPDWGDRFSVIGRFTQPLLARNGDWRRWSGSTYASLPRADVRELRRHVSLPFELSEGNGALRAWFDVTAGQPMSATVDMALRSVSLRLDSTVSALRFEQVAGRLTATRNSEGVTLKAQDISFLTGDNIRWPQGDMQLTWRQREGQSPSGGDFSAQRIDLAQVAQIATRIPLGDALRRLLAELKPQGVIAGLDAHWEGPLDAPVRYRVAGKLSGLSLASRAATAPGAVGRPGLRNASLQLNATESGGEARIGITGGALDLPGVFEQAVVPIDQLTARMSWKIEPVRLPRGAKASATPVPPKLTVQINDAHFSNPDARADLNATWRTGSGSAAGLSRDGRYPGRLELDGKLANADAARVYRYLPLGIGGETRGYIEHAIQGGRLTSASFHVKGDLWDFPFFNIPKGGDGEFQIVAKVDDATYAYVPGTPAGPGVAAYTSPWPVLTRASAELTLERDTLEIRNGSARIGNIEWSNVAGAIRHLERDAMLTLDAAGRGPASEMLRFVNDTPVSGWIGKALDSSTATGTADLKLNLGVPLMHVDTSTVIGSVALGGSDVRISPGSPLLGDARGRVDFSDKGFSVVGASARLYGGEVSFEGGQQANGSLRFTGQGIASAEGLRRATDLGPLSRIAGSLAGQTPYRMSLGFAHGEAEVDITSNLVGMVINLPAPLNKTAEAPLPMRYRNTVDPQSAAIRSSSSSRTASNTGAGLRDTLQFDLGSLVQAHFVRELSSQAPRVLRGGIGVLEPAPTPTAGVAANVNLKALDLDAWEAASDKLFGASAASAPGGTAGYEPDSIALRVQEFSTGSRRLTRLVAGISQDHGTWRANLDAEQLHGYVEYRASGRRGATAAPGGQVFARLSRLSLPKSDVEQVESLLDVQPTSVPSLDVVIEDFELRGKRLGRLEIEAVNRAVGPGREALRDWDLSKFNITTPEARLTATGRWTATGVPSGHGTPSSRRAVMDFKLALADSGALLDRLGTRDAIRGGKGQLSGQVAWLGSPFALDYASLSGQVNVGIEAGQFLKADPGAARLLGVLSLQSLPRRLSLDFRDLFQEGFAFDSITGDLKITQGVAQTNNLRMRGVQAVVLMEGRADIERETQDLRVIVVPEINAGTAALAYAVINPVLGLGAFLAQAILKKPLTQAGTREFHVSGPWADPKVAQVQRKLTDAVPALSGEPTPADTLSKTP